MNHRKRVTSGAVLVTGASTGIGSATAAMLAERGFQVFAGVRKRVDGETLRVRIGGGITPVILDVTDAESIAAAAREVSEAVGDRGLAGLVNNAGIGMSWPIEEIPLDELRRSFEVNVFGQVAVSQAFLPLIREAAGRIVNIGSVGDRLTIPFGAPLTSAKWALASITEAMRLELRPWGIHVVLIEPASIRTPAVDKLERDAETNLATISGRYAASYRTMITSAARLEQGGSSPAVVGATVLKALTAPRPSTRYLVGKHGGTLAFMARWLPDRTFDMIRVRLFGLPKRFGGMRGPAQAGSR